MLPLDLFGKMHFLYFAVAIRVMRCYLIVSTVIDMGNVEIFSVSPGLQLKNTNKHERSFRLKLIYCYVPTPWRECVDLQI